jgi:hypothetical protein
MHRARQVVATVVASHGEINAARTFRDRLAAPDETTA